MFKNIFMLHPYLGMQPRARAGGICCTISLPANQNDLPFAVLPRMIKRFFNRFIGEEYDFLHMVKKILHPSVQAGKNMVE